MDLLYNSALTLWSRMKFAWHFVINDEITPTMAFSNGVTIDLSKNTIIMKNPTTLHCNDTFTISSDKHLILNSGKDVVGNNDNYVHGIWLNSKLDCNGNPILVFDEIEEDI